MRIIVALLSWCFVITCLVGVYLWYWLGNPVVVRDFSEVYEIKKGETLSSVSRDLQHKGLLRWPYAWVLYARVMSLSEIKAGEYRLAGRESPLSLLARFQKGELIQHQITLVEGLDFKVFLQTLHNHGRIEIKLNSPESIDEWLKGLTPFSSDFSVSHAEGWFFPDTYNFSTGDSDAEILERAYLKMHQVLTEEWQQKEAGLPYSSPYEALVMASIVEKETGAAFERKQISGVFVRRLQQGMRLQTDPTVIYGVGDAFDGNLTRKHLRTPTPYNTYTIKGLPPTPIAMPGRAAIHAALHPAKGKALYFVAKGDGTHAFSATLAQHKKAVTKYQKTRRKNYRSSPD